MAVENITLNLIPTGDTPSIHVAQFDVDRPFTVTLKEGEDDFTPTDYDIELQVRKVDNNIVTTVPAQTSGNVVTFNTTEQMTACSGTNIAELQLTKDSQTFATLHFYLVVQRDVLAGGVTSASAIHDLEEQIAAIVPEVIGDEYYTAEEVDEKIAEIPTFDPTNYYDKSDVDTLLNGKADVSDLPDMTNYYDKSDVDTLLNGKADVSDLPDMSNYYNKTEVDNKITDLYQIKTASGNIVHITDGGNNIPVKSLTSQITAVESGSGEKSPENPYTISGFDNGIITRCGKNLANFTDGYGISTSGEIVLNVKRTSTVNPIKVDNTKPYVFTFAGSNIVGAYAVWNNNTLVRRITGFGGGSIDVSGGNLVYLSCYNLSESSSTPPTTKADCTPQLEQNTTATTFEAYNGNTYTFAFGQNVYGGYFDNKGNLVVTHGTVDLGSLNYIVTASRLFATTALSRVIKTPASTTIVGNINSTIYFPITSSAITGPLSPNPSPDGAMAVNPAGTLYFNNVSITTASDFETAMNGVMLYYELATPITLSITSQDIPTLLGENNFFSNTGDVEVEYFTEKSDGIAELIKAFM